MRIEILRLAQMQERRFRVHDKTRGLGWQTADSEDLLWDAFRHLNMLNAAGEVSPDDPATVLTAAADLANTAVLLARNAGAFSVSHLPLPLTGPLSDASIRCEIGRLAVEQERRFQRHDATKGDSWKGRSPEWILIDGYRGAERLASYVRGGTKDLHAVLDAAADLANYALMICHQSGALELSSGLPSDSEAAPAPAG